MRASILVGAYNEGHRLWKTVESILETIGDLDAELVIANDGSTDRSIEELRQHFPRTLVVEHKERQGVAATRGLAANRARGEVLIFLDGHTKPEPGALERLVASVEMTQRQAVITPQIVGLDETTWKSQPQQLGNGYALDLETFDSWWLPLKKMKEAKEGGQIFFESPSLIGCALAVSRELYDRLWGFDPHMRQWGTEDVDFALKAWTMGSRVLHDPGATIAHRFQRHFGDYEVSAEYPLANQIRAARKHFTPSVWEDWLVRAQDQKRLKLRNHPEGLWASAWEIFQRDRKSAEHERSYLLSRRQQDEFWYAKRFDRSWPTFGGVNLLAQASLPPHVLFADPLASPPPPSPTISSFSPSSGYQGDLNLPIAIYGSNLAHCTVSGDDELSFSNVDASSSTEVTASYTIASDASTGTHTVTLANTYGSAQKEFTVLAFIPELSGINPDSGQQGAEQLSVTLTGSGFVPTTSGLMTVHVDSGITAVVSGTTTQTNIPALFTIPWSADVGSASVYVTSPNGNSSNSIAFSITAGPTPSISSISPNEGAQSKTVSISISGSGLANVGINVPTGISVTSLNNSSATLTTAKFVIAENAPLGAHSITVTNENHKTSNAVTFTIIS